MLTRVLLLPIILLGLVSSGSRAQSAPATASSTTDTLRRLRSENDSLRRLLDSLRGPGRSPNTTGSSSASSAEGGPFGLTMGLSERSVRSLVRLDTVSGQRGVFRASTLPRPFAGFEWYTLVISPREGLCKVSGVGRDVSTSVFGTEAKSAFERIEELVTEKYGTPRKFDFLRSGSIWDEPRDWMMGLLRQERVLAAYWSADVGSSLPSHIASIGLEMQALSTDKAYARLGFEFSNFAACSAELKTNPF